MWCIYSEAPDETRAVEVFETEDDARKVLSVLESVNVSFNSYRIAEVFEGEVKDITYPVGTRLKKKQGYQYIGDVIMQGYTKSGKERVVIEMDGTGILHIFDPEQCEETEEKMVLTVIGTELPF